MTSSTLQFNRGHVVTDIDLAEGVVGIKLITSYYVEQVFRMYISGEPYLYASFGEAVISVHWAAANLTCQEAQKNHSRYACVSANSTCLGVNSTDGYLDIGANAWMVFMEILMLLMVVKVCYSALPCFLSSPSVFQPLPRVFGLRFLYIF